MTVTEARPTPGRQTSHHRRLPGLDGLRALAVLGVLGFHSGWTWLRGGFLGVSLFFTLSGFLITRLLLFERRDTGGIDLLRFWSRRARRLLPAAFTAIGLAIVVTVSVGTPSQRHALSADVSAALFYVANWRFVLQGASYAGLFEAPSALQHMWSLAVEEQMYLVVPLLVTGLLVTRGRRVTRWAVASLAAVATAVAATVATTAAPDTLYYGSHVRGVELLIGVCLALTVSAPDRRAPAFVTHAAGPVALAAVLWSWTVVHTSATGLYRGGLAGHALLVAVVLWAVTSGGTVLTEALEWRPLVWIGRRSYGIYVYHWPLFLLAHQAHVDLSRPVALSAAWAASFALAAVSYTWLEQPIRTGTALRDPSRARRLAVAVPMIVLVVAVSLTRNDPAVADPEVAARQLDALTATSTTTSPVTAAAAAPTTVPAVPPRLAIFGDSIAATTGLGLVQWANDTGAFTPVASVTVPGCTLVAEGSRWNGDQEIPVSPGCDWHRSWPATVADSKPDVAVIAMGGLDGLPWTLPGVEGRVNLGDPVVDQRVRAQIDAVNDMMLAAGVLPVWLTLPPPVGENGTAEHLARFNQIIEEAADRSSRIHVLDLSHLIDAWPRSIDEERRSDGTHLDPDASRYVADTWLGPQLLQLLTPVGVS